MSPPDSIHRWYHLTPDRFFIGLLAAQVLLLLSERFQWFAFNEHKGWTVLIAIGAVCASVVVMLVWFVVSLCLRRRFQFGFRSLLVFLLAVSVPLGWFAWEMEKARRQMEAIEAIGGKYAGGYVLYDYQYDETEKWIEDAEPTTPIWLRKILGDDFFMDVIRFGVGLPNPFGDEHMPHLKTFANCESVGLGNTEITDAGVEHLKELENLESLDLDNTHVTDAGVAHLKTLPNLGYLSLRGTHITDLGLRHLRALASLRVLKLDGTPITDAGLERLHGLTKLEWLFLAGSQATEEGVKKLQVALPDCGIIHGSAIAYGGKERAMRHVGQPGWRFLLDRVGNKK